MSQTRRTISRAATAAIATGVGLSFLAACGSSSSSDSAGSAAKDDSASAAGVATAKKDIAQVQDPITSWPAVTPIAKPVDLHGKRITLVPLGTNIPVINGSTNAVKTALTHMGASVNICDGKFDPSAVSSCLRQAQTDKVDAVMSLFVDYKMAPNSFDAVQKAGIPVLVANEPPSPGKQITSNFAFFDNSETVVQNMQKLSEVALADKGTDANALWLTLTDSPTTVKSTSAGVDEFKKLCPTCGLATTSFTTANLDKLPSAVSAALVSHPKTNVVIVPVDSFVSAATQGVQSAGYTNKVEVVSASGALDALQRVKSGTLAHDFGTSVVYEGYTMANAMVQLLSGEKVTPDTHSVTRDFNKDNVADLPLTTAAYNTPQWYGSDSFEQAFYKAWGEK